MTNIRWNYVRAFMIGLFFLLSLSKVFSCLADLNHINENFLFVYEDREMAEVLSEKSALYGISCKSWFPEDVDFTGGMEAVRQKAAGLLKVTETDAMSYHKITDYFQSHDGKIETDLFKWLQQALFIVFVIGTVLLFRKKTKNTAEKRDIRLSYGMVILVWCLYAKSAPGIWKLPLWILPGKWSDFEGWRALGDSIGAQMFTLIQYQDIPEVGQVGSAFYGMIIFLILSFCLLVLYRRCCVNLHDSVILHVILGVMAFGIYMTCGNPEMKALIYFIPCFAVSEAVTDGNGKLFLHK